jgi:putative transposase
MHKHRKPIRLRNYDYSQSGGYFVTICTYHRECLFGKIADGRMVLNKIGEVVSEEWVKTEIARKNVEIDVFVVMPNHIHGIMVLLENSVGATRRVVPTIGLASGSIGAIVGQFKSTVTKRINLIREAPALPFWQRNYYEHIIRNEIELSRIGEYIENNPLKWELDRENPQSKNFNLEHDLYWKKIYE